MPSQQEIIQQIDHFKTIAEKELGIKLPKISVDFDLHDSETMGYACDTTITLNLNHKCHKDNNQLLNDTIPHEVAHVVCNIYPQFGCDHDEGWKNVCKLFGIMGNATIVEINDRGTHGSRKKGFVYTNTLGKQVAVSKKMHLRIQDQVNRSASFVCLGGGEITHKCPFVYYK